MYDFRTNFEFNPLVPALHMKVSFRERITEIADETKQ